MDKKSDKCGKNIYTCKIQSYLNVIKSAFLDNKIQLKKCFGNCKIYANV